MKLQYRATFLRQLKKLEKDLQEEVLEKLNLLKDKENFKQLKVHKLQERLKDFFSFSVNYKYRIIFSYENTKIINILVVGDHNVYK